MMLRSLPSRRCGYNGSALGPRRFVTGRFAGERRDRRHVGADLSSVSAEGDAFDMCLRFCFSELFVSCGRWHGLVLKAVTGLLTHDTARWSNRCR